MRGFLFLTLANNLPRLKVYNEARCRLLRLAGVQISEDCTIWGPLTIAPIEGIKNIQIGKGTFINTEIRFGVPKDKVIIGDNVQIGPRVMFETVSHGLQYISGQGRSSQSKPIVVEDEVWIGGGAIILQGVTIGRGSVVAAGAVVTKDVEPNTVVAGIPARFLRRTDEKKEVNN
ncbi:MAG: DapH/DapD/GlmU-related protein [Cyanobacteria bacterium J06592_8]